jgi:hypothetical protein
MRVKVDVACTVSHLLTLFSMVAKIVAGELQSFNELLTVPAQQRTVRVDAFAQTTSVFANGFIDQ